MPNLFSSQVTKKIKEKRMKKEGILNQYFLMFLSGRNKKSNSTKQLVVPGPVESWMRFSRAPADSKLEVKDDNYFPVHTFSLQPNEVLWNSPYLINQPRLWLHVNNRILLAKTETKLANPVESLSLDSRLRDELVIIILII